MGNEPAGSAPMTPPTSPPNQKTFLEKYLSSEILKEKSNSCSKAAELNLAGFSLEDIQIALQTKERPNPASKLPLHYHHHLPVFSHEGADSLSPHRDCDHKIDLKPGTVPPMVLYIICLSMN